MKQKILYLCIAVCTLCSSGMAATNSTLYTDSFESYTNGTQLVDTNSWYSSMSAEGVVATVVSNTTLAAAGSTNVAIIPLDVTLSNRYAAAISTNVWLHMQPKIVRYGGSNNPSYDTNATAMFYVDSNGYCVVRNGTSGWVTITKTLSGNDPSLIDTNLFYTMDVYLDYTNKTWRLNVNSVPFTNNIRFINTNIASFTGFEIYNSGFATTYLDNVSAYDISMLPVLSVSPAALTNTIVYLSTATSQSFEVRSSGDGQLDYCVITNDLTWGGRSPWARITNAATGTLAYNATNTVWVEYLDTATMPPGAYYNSFDVISTNLEGQSNNVQLTFNILGMSVNTNSLASSKMLGYAADTQSFNVYQSGAGSVDYAIRTNPAVSWLYVSPGTGTLAALNTNTHSVSYSTNGLTVGTSMTTIEVASAGSAVTQFITVAMTTYSRPAPKTSFTNYSQTIQKGQTPTSTNMGVWNSGVAPIPRMNYAVTSDVSWMTVNTSGTTTTNETNSITVSFAAAMTNYSGLYTGHLTVRGTDAGPASSYSPTGLVTVSTQVTVNVLIYAPGKPGGLTATKGTYADRVNLAWSTTTNLNHFELWQGTNSSVANATRFVASAGTAISYSDTGLMPGIITYYWVRTINNYGGAGAYSESDTGWFSLPGPTGLTASDGLYTNRVALSWTASYGAQTYEIRRSELVTLSNSAILVSTVSAALTAYDDTSAAVETRYYYWIKSCTPYMSTFGEPETGYRAALMQPAGVTASDGEFTNKVRVIWQTVEKASSYEVWRNTSNDRSGATKIGDTTASGYDDESAAQGTYFYYWIRASSYEGFSQYSDSDYGWRQLTAPSGITASDGTYPYRIKVSWDPSENASGYEVWRGQGTGIGGGANAAVLKMGVTANTYYNDHETIVSTPYYYRVRAISALGGSSDYSSSDYGWREIAPATTTLPVKNDYDGDHLSDLPLYNSASGDWQILCSIIGQFGLAFGSTTSYGVQGDYDGDGVSDPMVYNSSQGTWSVMLSSIGYYPTITCYFGAGAEAAPADYDGDGITDLVVYNEAGAYLSVVFSNGGAFDVPVTVTIGGAGWSLVSADYDGDGKADPAVYSESEGLLKASFSGSGYMLVPVLVGGPGMTMHPADCDGDKKADLVTYKEATGAWSVNLSVMGYVPPIQLTTGGAGYRPIMADYDGDSLSDPAVYSESTGNWMILFSGSGYALITDTYGGTNSLPVGR